MEGEKRPHFFPGQLPRQQYESMGCLSWTAETCTSAKFTNLFEKRLNYTAYLLLPHRQVCCTPRYIAKVAGGFL